MIYYITGGERSGKSSYAEKLAGELSNNPFYLATSRKFDDTDFIARINRHINDRNNSGVNWQTIEEERFLSATIAKQCHRDAVVVIDCVTLWLTNYVLDYDYEIESCLTLAKQEIEQLVQLTKENHLTVFIISNEIGMSLHAGTAEGRKFVSLQGWVNQYIAKLADKVTLVVSGLPMVLK